jgi:hypothetical protein
VTTKKGSFLGVKNGVKKGSKKGSKKGVFGHPSKIMIGVIWTQNGQKQRFWGWYSPRAVLLMQTSKMAQNRRFWGVLATPSKMAYFEHY